MTNAVTRIASGLYQLSRPDPVASWAGGAFAVGAGIAVSDVGTAILWRDGLIALVGVVVAIAFGAHGLNDVYDWLSGTDKASIGKGTGGSRVIPDEKLSVLETAVIGTGALTITAAVGVYFYLKYGWPILALTVVAVGAPVVYSLPPFKFAYRPFPELIVVTPALTGVTVGSELVLAGHTSALAVVAGLIHSAFCISWYMVSRVPDYEPDKGVGKTTTVVFLGRDNAPLISAVYLMTGVAFAAAATVQWGLAFAVTPAFAAFLLVGLVRLDPYDPEHASRVRYRQMRTTTVHAAALAVLIALVGV